MQNLQRKDRFASQNILEEARTAWNQGKVGRVFSVNRLRVCRHRSGINSLTWYHFIHLILRNNSVVRVTKHLQQVDRSLVILFRNGLVRLFFTRLGFFIGVETSSPKLLVNFCLRRMA